jgi:hypothetical protein
MGLPEMEDVLSVLRAAGSHKILLQALEVGRRRAAWWIGGRRAAWLHAHDEGRRSGEVQVAGGETQERGRGAYGSALLAVAWCQHV